MANDAKVSEASGNMYVEPLVQSFKVIVRFCDVFMVMPRMLFSTLLYDTPHGRPELSGESGRPG